MNLYAIGEQYAAIMAAVEERGGELTPEQAATLDGIEAEFPVRAENLCKYLKNCETESAGLKAERDRLYARQKVVDATRDRLKDYLEATMLKLNIEKQDAGTFRLAIVQNGGKPSVNWTLTPALIPEELRKIQEPELDKAKIHELIAAGTELPEGIEVVKPGKGLRIR